MNIHCHVRRASATVEETFDPAQAFPVEGWSDVPIGQIKQSKNQPGQIYPAIAVAPAFAFTSSTDSLDWFCRGLRKLVANDTCLLHSAYSGIPRHPSSHPYVLFLPHPSLPTSYLVT